MDSGQYNPLNPDLASNFKKEPRTITGVKVQKPGETKRKVKAELRPT
jgi:hypothetical protein